MVFIFRSMIALQNVYEWNPTNIPCHTISSKTSLNKVNHMQENITAQSAILNICQTETVCQKNIKTMHRIMSILLIVSTVILQYLKRVPQMSINIRY